MVFPPEDAGQEETSLEKKIITQRNCRVSVVDPTSGGSGRQPLNE